MQSFFFTSAQEKTCASARKLSGKLSNPVASLTGAHHGGGLSINLVNWKSNSTTTFINLLIAGIPKTSRQAVSLGVGPGISLGEPADFGCKGVLTLVFPK
jgi:hypothetical protein